MKSPCNAAWRVMNIVRRDYFSGKENNPGLLHFCSFEYIYLDGISLTGWDDFFKRWKINDSMCDYIHTYLYKGGTSTDNC